MTEGWAAKLRVAEVQARHPQVATLLNELTSELALGGYTADETFGYSVDQLENNPVELVGAWIDGQLVGVGGLERQDHDTGELKRFFVSPHQRGAGVADAILNALIDRAREHGLDRLRLETGDKQLAAIKFYGRHSFVDVPPFGPYIDSATSVCMQRDLR